MAGQRFWELTFDADGDTDAGARDRFLTEVRDAGLTDLVVFSHGWNNDHRIATALYERFFGLLAGQLPAGRRDSVGLVGVFWPSQRWSDEPIPDFAAAPAAGGGGRGGGAAGDRGRRRAGAGQGDAGPAAGAVPGRGRPAGRDGRAARLAADRRGADEVPRPAGRVLHPGRRGRRRRRGHRADAAADAHRRRPHAVRALPGHAELARGDLPGQRCRRGRRGGRARRRAARHLAGGQGGAAPGDVLADEEAGPASSARPASVRCSAGCRSGCTWSATASVPAWCRTRWPGCRTGPRR